MEQNKTTKAAKGAEAPAAQTMTFNEKIIALQNELKAPKSRYNSFGKYAYRSCEDIVEAVKPLCQKYGLLLNLSDRVDYFGGSERAGSEDKVKAGRFYVKAEAMLTDGEHYMTSSGWAREEETKKGMDGSQITGTASSYARKYALNGLLLIDDTKDADTDEYAKQTGGKEGKADKVAPNWLLEISKMKDIADLEIWWANNLDTLREQKNFGEIRQAANNKAEELQR